MSKHNLKQSCVEARNYENRNGKDYEIMAACGRQHCLHVKLMKKEEI